MDETEFWELVDGAREAADGDLDEQVDLLVERLSRRDPETVLDFARHFEVRLVRSYTWELWGATRLLLGTSSEDAFDGFRCWLIGQGRRVFERALVEPDELAELLETFDPALDGDGEDLWYAPDEAYERLTGGEPPELGLPEPPSRPTGTPLNLTNEAALAERFPALWRRFSGR